MTPPQNGTPPDYQLIGPSDGGTVSDLLAGISSPKDGNQRLQALIAEWLRMENAVVLAGSGCSVSSGGKLRDGLERVILDTLAAASGAPVSIKSIVSARLAL